METTLDPKLYKPLLAATASLEDLDKLTYPLLASPKIDGIRCLMIRGKAYSRSLKLIRNKHVQELAKIMYEEQGLPTLDGELTAGDYKTKFQDTTSEIMSVDGGADFTYNIFDTLETGSFYHRCACLGKSTWHPVGKVFGVIPVEQYHVTSKAHILHYLETFLEQGYEGAMLRSPTAFYKHGRSTLREEILLKLKPFADAEATIVGLKPLLVNTNEATINELGHTHRSSSLAGKEPLAMLGSLECITPEGIKFSIGTGFTEVQRADLWTTPNLIGSLVHYKYQNYGIKEAPRCPVFLNLIKEKE